MRKHRIRVWTMVWIIAIGLLLPALAAEEREIINVPVIGINGFDWVPSHPAWAAGAAWVEDGVTMVPAEEFFQTLAGRSLLTPAGVLTRWDEDGRNEFRVTWGYDHALLLTPGAETMRVDGREVALPLPARFEDGVFCVPLRAVAEALGMTVSWSGIPEVSFPKTQVTVDSLEDLFNAVAPDTEITLALGEYSCGELDLAKIDNPYVEISYDVFDTATGLWGTGAVWEAVIRDVRDLTIVAEGCRISTPWAYADVWRFAGCDRLRMKGGLAVHDVEPGYCVGNCVELEDCRGVYLRDVVMDGSGAYGLCANSSRQVELDQCTIQNCTYGAVSLSNCQDMELWMCRVADCRDCFALVGSDETRDVRIRYCTFENNSADSLTACDGRNLVFGHCTFRDNTFGQVQKYGWQSSGGAAFFECTWLDEE